MKDSTALVISDIYCTVFTTKDLNNLQKINGDILSRTLISSEVLVVDLLFENEIYKKVPVSNLEKVR
tara:strand:+ start:708 stop:908 length:201 start_codon:yes stop_codon:yes gene_type:complete